MEKRTRPTCGQKDICHKPGTTQGDSWDGRRWMSLHVENSAEPLNRKVLTECHEKKAVLLPETRYTLRLAIDSHKHRLAQTLYISQHKMPNVRPNTMNSCTLLGEQIHARQPPVIVTTWLSLCFLRLLSFNCFLQSVYIFSLFVCILNRLLMQECYSFRLSLCVSLTVCLSLHNY